ncbi:MAG: hypothetical protein PHH54_02070 [Candidatus Nanoarchaeia archaeon]|nr:hypothetical protein [Candidatus Nanoarchaeia archaeon]MDD5740748.1 hypothetical protein [Candidatus Nanoarchaeia archaeon]
MKVGTELMLGDGKGKAQALTRPAEGTYLLNLGNIEKGVAYFSVTKKKGEYSGELEATIDDEFRKEFGENVKIGDFFKMIVQYVGKKDYTLKIIPPKVSNKGRYCPREKRMRRLAYYEKKYRGV